jgi:hypothetical protein
MTAPLPIDLSSSFTRHALNQQANHFQLSLTKLTTELQKRFPQVPTHLPYVLTRAVMTLNLTVHGETYSIRHQAKARGYTWRAGAWHLPLSTPLFTLETAAIQYGLVQLRQLVSTEQTFFQRECSVDQPLLVRPGEIG